MILNARRALAATVVALALAVGAPPAWAAPTAEQIGRIRAMLRRAPRQRDGTVMPGHMALLRARLTDPAKIDARRAIRLKDNVYRGQLSDPTFRGKHPMFRRLLRRGWFSKRGKREALQKLADHLVYNKRIDRRTPLDQVEFISFDLEATGQPSGHWDHKRNSFVSGWGEITQFGYTVHKGGKIIEHGTIDIRPTARIDRRVTRLNPHMTRDALAKAPRFEQVAAKILRVLDGRVLVGQSAQEKDWSWLRSNFARLGVDLPGQSGMILDTYLMSHNHFRNGAGVDDMAKAWNIPLVGAHDAQVDAKATAAAFFHMLEVGHAKTLGDAFALQSRGMRRMRNIPALARQHKRIAAKRATAYLVERGVAADSASRVSARGQTDDGRGTRVRVSIAGAKQFVVVDNKSGTVTPEDAAALDAAITKHVGQSR